MTDLPTRDPLLVSVVVPALEEEATLGACLDALAELAGHFEVIVSDGGSTDATREIAARHHVVDVVIDAPRGRARQMNAGAERATGEAILFLHADTRLPVGAWQEVAGALADPEISGGNFRLRFDGGGVFSALLGLVYAIQRRNGVYYGDSAIFIRKDVFHDLGGYRDQLIMEDFEMARNIARRGRDVCLPGPAVTSPRRWRRSGIPRTVFSWLLVRWLYQFGVSPSRLARLYRVIR